MNLQDWYLAIEHLLRFQADGNDEKANAAQRVIDAYAFYVVQPSTLRLCRFELAVDTYRREYE